MAKLIKLPDGKYIKADKIISVGEVWTCEDNKWFYTICHLDNYETVAFHTVKLHETFMKTEEKALAKQRSFVEVVNENL